jgi:hypothetical protein
MNESLLVAGIVCIVASIVGGGVKLLGAEVPVLNSFARQALLFTVGLAFLAASYLTSLPKVAKTTPVPTPTTAPSPSVATPAPTTSMGSGPASPTTPQSGCSPATGLACLPASSRPAVFADTAAANSAAWRDYQKGLSTTAGESLATSEGASGKAARLCGIVASSDSSALGKHLAAVALSSHTAAGDSTPSCLSAAAAYL